jgi:hypothetical protein
VKPNDEIRGLWQTLEMSSQTTWEETVVALRGLILRCCMTESGWQLPAVIVPSAARELELDQWIKTTLSPTCPIPLELRWLLLQRARAAGSFVETALSHGMALPVTAQTQLLGLLLLVVAKKVAALPPLTVPPWLE